MKRLRKEDLQLKKVKEELEEEKREGQEKKNYRWT